MGRYSGSVSLKKFEILELIAKGGMAEVYRARTTGLEGFEKEFCVKKILPHLTEDESFVTMFINEAKLAATLSCANIVQVHDLCVSAEGEYFIVMELIDGKDLSDIIRAAQIAGCDLPPEIAVYITREVCHGLAYAHARTDRSGAPLKVIHRDISPHNVLVSFDGEVKIVDFGIAKASSIMTNTAVGVLKGKYGYMSPEQACGQPLDARSDIFNTGIVLYEMLVGERCFAGSSDFSTLNLMRNAEVTPPTQLNSRVPKSLEAIVLQALSKDRDARPKTSAELERQLGDWARAESAIATKSELAAFMQDLFREEQVHSNRANTGVLEVQSLAGPIPTPKSPAAERAKSLADRSIEPPSEANRARQADASPEANDDSPEPMRAGRPVADTATPSEEEAPRRDPPMNERSPRSEPRRAAVLSKVALAPVLRRTALTGAVVALLAAGMGAGIGRWRARSVSQQSTFRTMEQTGRRAPVPKTTLVLIRSTPPGLEVRLDGLRLAHPTPVVVERPSDGKDHPIELRQNGDVLHRGTLQFRKGPLTRYEATLSEPKRAPEGLHGHLRIAAGSGVRVRIDGQAQGRVADGPFALSADGSHEVVLQAGRVRRRLLVRVAPGEERTLTLDL